MKTPFAVLTATLFFRSFLVAAPQPGTELANFDARRQGVKQPQILTAQRETAASELKGNIPGLRIDLDDVTAAPSWIQSDIGFLAGPDVEEPIIPNAAQPVSPRVDPHDPHRSIKQFLDENAALFGHDSAILKDARISLRPFRVASQNLTASLQGRISQFNNLSTRPFRVASHNSTI